jgi:DNA polymerase III delta prime subunit
MSDVFSFLFKNQNMVRKRFINVMYGNNKSEIDTHKMERLSEIRDIIKEQYEITRGSAFIQLWQKTEAINTLITTWKQLKLLPASYFTEEDGCFLTIQLLPSPTLSRQTSESSLVEGILNLLIATDTGRKKRKTEWETSKLGTLVYNPNSTLFQLDTNYLAKTGLPTQKLVLYCRPTFHEQFKFLRERVVDNGVLGWILGPPGTGKSTTALAFASTLDKNDWIVTWIHLEREDYPVCVRLEDDLKKSKEIHDNNINELLDILDDEDVSGSKKHIVFIDGYALNGDKHIDIQKACYSWLKKNRESRRLVVVCSMATRYKSKKEKDIMLNLEQFFVYSWTEDEYLLAVKNDAFYMHVKTALGAGIKNDSTREDLVRSKLYFAGASARWMFLFDLKAVIEQTDESVSKVTDVMPYIKGTVGDLSNNVVNRLFSSSLAQHGLFRRKTSIVSRFAGIMLAIKVGPELIRHLAEATRHDGNPAMDGWMLEMWFFASLRHGGVNLLNKKGMVSQTLAESNIETLDITSFPSLPKTTGLWYKPKKWNQGGYDAIYIDKNKGIVKFVQVTGGDKHSFKIQYFYQFLLALSQSEQSFQIKSLDILFLVEQKKLGTFKLAKPSGQGLLEPFGWMKGKEKSKVKIVGVIGWNDQ